MKIVDLKLTDKEKKKMQEPVEYLDNRDVPYGMSLGLSDREVRMVGLDKKNLDAGDEIVATVRLRLLETSERKSTEEGEKMHMEFSVIGMGVDEQDKPAQQADAMYGDS